MGIYLIQKYMFIYKYNLDCSTIYIITSKQIRKVAFTCIDGFYTLLYFNSFIEI